MASPRKKWKKKYPNMKLPDFIREQLPERAADIPKKSNFYGLETTSYLAKMVSCLELNYPDVAELKNRYWYDSLEEQYSKLGQLTFVTNWFNNKPTPEIGKAYEEVDLSNLYHISLLCSYTERYGVPESKWFRKACIDRANESLYSLPEGNLLFHKLLTRTANKGWGEELITVEGRVKPSKLPAGNFKMSKIQNAAGICGRPRELFDAEFKHKVLEQALLKKTEHKSFNFGSKDIKYVFRWLSDEEIIQSRYQTKLNTVLPIWRRLVNRDY